MADSGQRIRVVHSRHLAEALTLTLNGRDTRHALYASSFLKLLKTDPPRGGQQRRFGSPLEQDIHRLACRVELSSQRLPAAPGSGG